MKPGSRVPYTLSPWAPVRRSVPWSLPGSDLQLAFARRQLLEFARAGGSGVLFGGDEEEGDDDAGDGVGGRKA